MSDRYTDFIERQIEPQIEEDLTESYEETISMLSELSATGSYPLPITHAIAYEGTGYINRDVIVVSMLADTRDGSIDGHIYAFDVAIDRDVADAFESGDGDNVDDFDEKIDMLQQDLQRTTQRIKQAIWQDVVNLDGDAE